MSRRIVTIWDFDWLTVGLYGGLVLIGYLMIYSAGFDPDAPTGFFDFGTFGGKQAIFALVSMLIGGAVLLIDPQFFKTFSIPIYAFVILLLLIVLGLNISTNGAASWIPLPGGVKLQPSEFAKFATCLALAVFMSRPHTSLQETKDVLPALGLFMLPAVLIVAQGDAGSALIFFSFMLALYREGLHPAIYIIGILMAILFVLGLIYPPLTVVTCLAYVACFVTVYGLKKRLPWIAALVVLGLAALWFFPEFPLYVLGAIGVYFLASVSANFSEKKGNLGTLITISVLALSGFTFSLNYAFYEILEPHQQDRINVWLMPEKCDYSGSLYNLTQSKLAIGSGGITGKGYLGGEMTQLNYVPEQHTDFIFTVLGEEQGFVGVFVVIALYIVLLIRLTFVAERQSSKFTRVFAYGVVGIFLLHLIVNIGMTMGLMPVIGIPLPLLSYGGSSLLSFTIMLALLVKFDSQRHLAFR